MIFNNTVRSLNIESPVTKYKNIESPVTKYINFTEGTSSK